MPLHQSAFTAGRKGRQWFFVAIRNMLAISLSLALSACQSIPAQSSASPQSEPEASNAESQAEFMRAVAGRPSEPFSPSAVRTTDGAIFLANINAQIETLRQRAEATQAPQWKRQYASLLYFRARVVGEANDYVRSHSVVEELLLNTPDDVETQMLAARLASALHQFDESKLHLDKASSLQPDASGLLEARSQLALALGQVDHALSLAKEQEADANDLGTLAYLGNLAMLQGDLAKAERLFGRAELRFNGSGPFLLSWLHTQHGIALLENDQIERADRYFRAAHERLPGYYLATEHLAETQLLLGNAESALTLYKQVYEQTRNPEFLAPMAEAQRALGHDETARRTLQRADKAWQEAIAMHPQANWQHAADYYLEQSKPIEALRLARLNIALRKDIGSWLLLARAEEASGNADRACQALTKARESGLNPPALRAAVKDLVDTCGSAVTMPRPSP